MTVAPGFVATGPINVWLSVRWTGRRDALTIVCLPGRRRPWAVFAAYYAGVNPETPRSSSPSSVDPARPPRPQRRHAGVVHAARIETTVGVPAEAGAVRG